MKSNCEVLRFVFANDQFGGTCYETNYPMGNLFASGIILSFFLPWSKHLQGISNGPVTGMEYTMIVSFLVFPVFGLVILAIPFCCVLIILQTLFGQNTWKLRKVTSISTVVLFLVGIGLHTMSGHYQGKPLSVSLAYQLSQTGYGVYVALVCAIGLMFCRRRDS